MERRGVWTATESRPVTGIFIKPPHGSIITSARTTPQNVRGFKRSKKRDKREEEKAGDLFSLATCRKLLSFMGRMIGEGLRRVYARHLRQSSPNLRHKPSSVP